eukprot:346415_1
MSNNNSRKRTIHQLHPDEEYNPESDDSVESEGEFTLNHGVKPSTSNVICPPKHKRRRKRSKSESNTTNSAHEQETNTNSSTTDPTNTASTSIQSNKRKKKTKSKYTKLTDQQFKRMVSKQQSTQFETVQNMAELNYLECLELFVSKTKNINHLLDYILDLKKKACGSELAAAILKGPKKVPKELETMRQLEYAILKNTGDVVKAYGLALNYNYDFPVHGASNINRITEVYNAFIKHGGYEGDFASLRNKDNILNNLVSIFAAKPSNNGYLLGIQTVYSLLGFTINALDKNNLVSNDYFQASFERHYKSTPFKAPQTPHKTLRNQKRSHKKESRFDQLMSHLSEMTSNQAPDSLLNEINHKLDSLSERMDGMEVECKQESSQEACAFTATSPEEIACDILGLDDEEQKKRMICQLFENPKQFMQKYCK